MHIGFHFIFFLIFYIIAAPLLP